MGVEAFLAEWQNDSPVILVHTSGSTGEPKPLWVEKRRMEASARMTCDFLGLRQGDTALLCMPLDYIAGKMMVVRALTCGLKLVEVPVSGHPQWDGHVDFAAMVPMQVYNLLQSQEGCQRLMQINHLIIGGGAIDEKMEEELRTFPHAVWSTYGMTETLSHIALRRLNGPEASEWYTPFENVSVSLADEGCLLIDAPLVCDHPLKTNDMAEMCDDGRFRILGRKDNTVCCGGIKIQIEEVERMLRPLLSESFMITKIKDEKFGEVLSLLTEDSDLQALRILCEEHLPKFWQPKHYFHVDQLPMTETGKPARKQAELMAMRLRVLQSK